MLSTLLSDWLSAQEKENILEKNFEFVTSAEMKGRKSALFDMVSKGLLRREDAAKELGITVEELDEQMKEEKYQ